MPKTVYVIMHHSIKLPLNHKTRNMNDEKKSTELKESRA